MTSRSIKFAGESRPRTPALHLIAAGLLLTVWAILFISGLRQYPGSSGHYVVFSLAFLAMLASGIYKRTTYAYLFLVVFLWLGFWLKLTAHQIFVYPFGEPIGLFDNSPAAWDRVLVIATSGSIGVMAARIIYGWAGWKSTLSGAATPAAPPWYPRIHKILWLALMLVLTGCSVLNAVYGIQQSGLVPRTLLIWPFNAAIYWMLGSGFAMCVATLGWWHLASKDTVGPAAYMVLIASTMSTVSLLSRGLYIFHTVPAMLAIYMNRARAKDLSPKRVSIYLVAFIAMMLVSLALVGVLREYYYSNVPPTLDGLTDARGAGASLRFIVDRWVGLEGVMAVSSYHDKGLDLFFSALTEKSEIGKSTLYQEVCLAHYRFMDLSKFQFASLPGAVAFFYYTDSLLLVMLGMMVLTMIALCSEKMVSGLTANPFLSAFWGCGMANFIAQFGVAPRGLGPHFVMSLLAILTIWLVQSNYFTGVLYKTGLLERAET
ncbi:MAG: hypothetical protein Q7K57_22085 [Burkholderiaceae bacterium]|nr:hypothetical protein [Burkholderiaceae bacterium]